jgi:hypothetical protein
VSTPKKVLQFSNARIPILVRLVGRLSGPVNLHSENTSSLIVISEVEIVSPPVIPKHNSEKGIEELLKLTAFNEQGSFFAALKNFGVINSPGLLSFPVHGTTFGVDISNVGSESLRILGQMADVVELYGGRIYPAKDAVMKSTHFKKFYPNWRKVNLFRDKSINSNFWRRILSDEL